MELSAETLDGLQILGNPAQIPDSCIKDFIERTINSLLNKEDRNPLSDSKFDGLDKGAMKQGHYALCTLLLEAAKHDRNATSFSHILEDCKFTPERIQVFSDLYTAYKSQLRILLSSTGNNPPHIVDVDWRLDYNVKTNNLEHVKEPTYLISLKTEECGNPDTKDVQFFCSQNQLQDLVGKLKDACKSLERAGQM